MKKGYVISVISLIAFFAFTFIVKTVNVAMIGPAGTSVGLAKINQAFHSHYGVNMTIYQITDPMMYLAILVAAFFGVMGLVQLIKRKSLLKVDREIVGLGVLFIVSMIIYALFEKVIINYRPTIMPGETMPEASFPSSHTMLVIVILGAAFMLAGRYIDKGAIRSLIRAVCALIIAVTVTGRLICGCHWLTDIIAGLLMSITLLSAYYGFISTKAGNSNSTRE